MNDKTQIDNYIANFRKAIAGYLNKGISVSAEVLPVEGIGGVIEFDLTSESAKDNWRTAYNSLVDAICSSKQTMVGKVGPGARFGGTNISLQGNKIVLIKGEPVDGENETALWDEKAAQNDVRQIIEMVRRSHK